MLVAKYEARVIDVKGAFLKWEFKNKQYLRDSKSTIPMTIYGYVSWSQSMDQNKQDYTTTGKPKGQCRPMGSNKVMQTHAYSLSGDLRELLW